MSGDTCAVSIHPHLIHVLNYKICETLAEPCSFCIGGCGCICAEREEGGAHGPGEQWYPEGQGRSLAVVATAISCVRRKGSCYWSIRNKKEL